MEEQLVDDDPISTTQEAVSLLSPGTDPATTFSPSSGYREQMLRFAVGGQPRRCEAPTRAADARSGSLGVPLRTPSRGGWEMDSSGNQDSHAHARTLKSFTEYQKRKRPE